MFENVLKYKRLKLTNPLRVYDDPVFKAAGFKVFQGAQVAEESNCQMDFFFFKERRVLGDFFDFLVAYQAFGVT